MNELPSVLLLACFLGWGCEANTTLSIGTTCGDAFVATAADPGTEENIRHRDEVAVHVRLNSTLTFSVAGTLRVTLTPDSPPPGVTVKTETGVLPPGATEGDVWFPISAVALSGRALVELIPDGLQEPTLRAEQEVRFDCVAACPANNVIVESPGAFGDCISAPGAQGVWRGEVAAVKRASSGSPASTYCSYYWQGDERPAAPAGIAPPDLKVFDGAAFAGSAWQVDCPVVTAQQAVAVPQPSTPPVPPGNLITPAELAQATEQRLGIDGLNQRSEWPINSERSVWLAIVDTAQHGFSDGFSPQGLGRDNSEHGRLMGLVAHRTACGRDPSCPVQIRNALALPVVQANAEPDYTNGGFIGTRGQLGHALHRLLDDWQLVAPNGEIPLVINLSVGWHSKHDCDPSPDGRALDLCGQPIQNDVPSLVRVPPVLGFDPGAGLESFNLGTRAVLIELARARCLGALVFAAAGNAVGQDDAGPVLPAGWNQLSFDANQCDTQLGIAPHASSVTSRQPLVSAVGAVDSLGQPLALTRQNSLPRLVAFGDAVAALDADAPQSGAPGWAGVVGPLSGTSLATAVVSGAAARLWANLPFSPGSAPLAEAVEEQLFGFADVTGVAPQLCSNSFACPEAHEVSACTPFVALGRGTSCVAARSLPAPAQPAPTPTSAPAAGVDCTTPDNPNPEDPAAAALPLCPESREEQVDHYEAPWVFPQPSGPSCITCSQQLLTLSGLAGVRGTQYTVSLTNALLLDRGTKLKAARLRAGPYSAALSPSLILNDFTLSTVTSSMGVLSNRPANWPLYNGSLQSPLATLEVDLTNLQGTPLTGVQSVAIPRVR